MEQNNITASQEQQTINTISDESYIATAYGVVSRSFVETLIADSGKPKKRPARVFLYISGIVSSVMLVIILIFSCIHVYDHFNGNTPDVNGSYDDGFSYTPDSDDDGIYNGGEADDYGDYSTSDSDSALSSSRTSDAGLGVIVSVLDSSVAKLYGIDGGLVIVGIPDNSSFIGSDVREYDIITGADGDKITSTTYLSSILNKHDVGDELTLTITRFSDGFAESFDVTVTLINKNE